MQLLCVYNGRRVSQCSYAVVNVVSDIRKVDDMPFMEYSGFGTETVRHTLHKKLQNI